MKLHKSLCVFFLLVVSHSCEIKQERPTSSFTLESFKHPPNYPDWLKINVEEALPNKDLNVWIPTGNFQTSSLIKVPRFPRKINEEEIKKMPQLKDFIISPVSESTSLKLSGVLNEQISAQIAIAATSHLTNVKVDISDLYSNSGNVLSKQNILARYVKYLPIQRARSEYLWSPKLEEVIGESSSGNMSPNLVGDALLNIKDVDVPAYHAQPIWFTFKIPENANPGIYKGKIELSIDGYDSASYPIEVQIENISLPAYRDYKFHLDLWVNPSSIAEVYHVKDWSEEHWDLIKIFLADYAKAGGKNCAVTITHEPWHKKWIGENTHSQTEFGYKSMVSWIKDKKGSWHFDYAVLDRYVELADSLGVAHAINAFSVTPFKSNQAIHYYDEADDSDKIMVLDYSDFEYKVIWKAFLKDFKEHLLKKGWFDKTYLGFDEKPKEILELILGIIEESAPEFLERIMIAGHNDVSSISKNLSISYMFFPNQPLEARAIEPVTSTIKSRNVDKKTTTFYLCAEPAHPNTLTYSPAIESRLIPWLALKFNTDGYLRWAYNNWTADTFNRPVFMHNQGDDYYVYPGENGLISSIRWELLKEGIEDYELFRIIEEKETVPIDSLNKAVHLATRNQDGRYKNVNDFTAARKLLMAQ